MNKTITEQPVRGGINATIAGGAVVALRLTLGQIERFEDKHRGIYDLWDSIVGDSAKPNSTEVRDLIALAIVGGGKTDSQATAILQKIEVSELLDLYEIAKAVLAAAFYPGLDDELAATPEGEVKKNSELADTESGGSSEQPQAPDTDPGKSEQ